MLSCNLAPYVVGQMSELSVELQHVGPCILYVTSEENSYCLDGKQSWKIGAWSLNIMNACMSPPRGIYSLPTAVLFQLSV